MARARGGRYAFVKPGGGITKDLQKAAVKGGAEFTSTAGLVEELGAAVERYAAVADEEPEPVRAAGARESSPAPIKSKRLSAPARLLGGKEEPKLSDTYPYALTPERLAVINKKAKGFGKESC